MSNDKEVNDVFCIATGIDKIQRMKTGETWVGQGH